MRLLVAGGRNYKDRERVFSEIDSIALNCDDLIIIHGSCPTGADNFADEWALENGVPCDAYPAEWQRYGRSAGPRRNQLMIDQGKPDMALLFPGGRGTKNMFDRLVKAGITTKVIGGWPS